MQSIREILRLSFAKKISVRQIAQSLRLSRAAVSDCLKKASSAGLSWPLPDNLDDTGLTALVYPPPSSQTRPRPKPDCAYIFHELKRKGVTLALLWEEYKRENPDGYQISQFSEIYRDWLKKCSLVMRQEHKAGHKAFSDFSGGTLKITDPTSGEIRLAKLFVCALGASSYTYAELFWGETSEAWCLGQAHSFEYFGGCPEIVVPDNPRAVVSKACKYEPRLNRDFLLMAQHFDVAIIPARVRKPKDKAVVEAAVGLATRWILARLRNQTFFSLNEANEIVRQLVDDLNKRKFKKMDGSRRTLFDLVDRTALRPLPANRYEYTHIQYATVPSDYHIEIDKSFYSVPHQLVGQRVEARISSQTVEVYFDARRVASHLKCEHANQRRRIDEHMPKEHRAYKDWTPARFCAWASKVGPHVGKFIESLFASKKHPELAYRASFGVLRLAKEYGNTRLDGACQRALSLNSLSYKTVKLILKNNMESRPPSVDAVPTQLQIVHSNIRGAEYFNTQKETTHADSSITGKSEESQIVRDGESPRNTACDA